jgi:hypothetical protein
VSLQVEQAKRVTLSGAWQSGQRALAMSIDDILKHNNNAYPQ